VLNQTNGGAKMIKEKNGIKYFVFQNLTNQGITHCFSTRTGGVSTGPYASLNLGYNKGDDDANVEENYTRLFDVMGFNKNNIVKSRQTHSTNVAAIEQTGIEPKDTDALMTNKTNIILATYYADCVPLLFYDPKKRVIANAHAGWRGVANNMALETVTAMVNHYDSNPNDIIAGIGPCISAKNFLVDQDVADEFKKQLPFSEKFIYNSEGVQGKYHINLRGTCRESLIKAGLNPENIEVTDLCTFDNPELFFSHRRDGLPRGSLAAFIMLK
jgi:hypothetical protein